MSKGVDCKSLEYVLAICKFKRLLFLKQRGSDMPCHVCRVGVRMVEANPSEGEKKSLGYCARIKKCASRDCWELGLSVSAREQLPDPDTHVFPLFEGTTLSEADRRELRRERIRFDESLPRLQDPRGALAGIVKFGGGLVRSVGAAPAEGNGAEGDKKPGGEKREKQRRERDEERALLDRGSELLKGKPVRNRKEMTAAMRDSCAKGALYKGELLSEERRTDEGGDERWDFTVETKGLDGSDTGRTYNVSIGRLCKCSCNSFEKMMADRSVGFTWCKHIYAVIMRVLRVDRHEPLMTAMRFNKAEMKSLFSKVPDLQGLKG
jgi:hypothetical protein